MGSLQGLFGLAQGFGSLLRPMKAPSVAPGKPKSNDSKSSKGKKAAKKAAAKKPRKSPKGDNAKGSKGE